MVVVSGADHVWNTAPRSATIGASTFMICSEAEGTAVCATLNADVAAAGEPVMNCLSALLPADATVSTPSADAASTAADRSSSNGWPYGEPSDMLMMSTRSAVFPSPLGSTAKSIARSSATPLHDEDAAAHAFNA